MKIEICIVLGKSVFHYFRMLLENWFQYRKVAVHCSENKPPRSTLDNIQRFQYNAPILLFIVWNIYNGLNYFYFFRLINDYIFLWIWTFCTPVSFWIGRIYWARHKNYVFFFLNYYFIIIEIPFNTIYLFKNMSLNL